MQLGLFFRTMQAMYVYITCRIEKKIKVCICGHVHTFWKGHGGKLRKMHAKTCNLGLFLLHLENTCLECVVKVILQG